MKKIIIGLILLSFLSAFMAYAPTSVAGSATLAVTSTPVPTSGPGEVIGPDSFPEGVNPLTGLSVENPENLLLPPALVSITNFPVSSRPQAGLSFSPFVFEIYIGEGMTRFLAMFYGDFPQVTEEDGGNGTSGTNVGSVTDNTLVGPIRSGRLPYESMRKLYNGFLVMASGASQVVSNLSSYANIYGSDADNINSAMIDVTKLEEIANKNQKRLGGASLSGLSFQTEPPADGKDAERIWLKYAYLNQINWRYDEETGAYLRYQDRADATNFELMTDRLTGDPLAFENVVILFANHEVVTPTIIDIDLLYMRKMPALLFRDGQMYEIFWTTKSGSYEVETGKLRPIRFMDAKGNEFPLKPGQTWVQVVQPFTPYYEVPDSEVFYDLANKKEPGSGVWAVRWYPPAGAR
ncbi:MAG: DUF3048 C-terminal domain-containing protein [Anaerolineaceae bacterium]|jgi:hypothetical protein|nr:DUF3048 C-terminal domain-containing protein [Anaerolineaceae bacterium]